ncbi:hypothetical protein B0J17DRAFT_771519 [Rhizoctonia solani]|nr:hypothetical protein B0J17DRAFT_771519 [Rhizoctonia solani]
MHRVPEMMLNMGSAVGPAVLLCRNPIQSLRKHSVAAYNALRIERLGPSQPPNKQDGPQYTTSTSRLPSGIPARKTAIPILPNQVTKRETSSTASSRLKSRTHRTVIHNPNTIPSVPPLPLIPSNRASQPTESTKSGAPIGLLAPRPQFAPNFKPPARLTVERSSPAPMSRLRPWALEPSTNTRRETSIRILPLNITISANVTPKGKLV